MIKRLSIVFCLLALSASALKVVHPVRPSDGLTRFDLSFDYDDFVAAGSVFSWSGDLPYFGIPTTGLMQWLTTLNADGYTVHDELGPLVVDPEPTLVGRNVLMFSGLASFKLDSAIEVDEFVFLAKPASDSDEYRVLINDAGDSFFGARSAGYWSLRNGGEWSVTTAYVIQNEWQEVKYIYNGTRYEVFVNGVSGGLLNISDKVDAIEIGSVIYGAYNGLLSNLTIKSGSLTYLYNLEEGQGLPLDSSGNGNHATDNTAMWVKDYSGLLPSANHSAGHTDYVVVTSTGAEVVALENEIAIDGGAYLNTVTGATRSDPLWSTRYVSAQDTLVGGEVVDCKNQLPIQWPGGYVHNNSECSIPSYSGTNSYADLIGYTNDTDSIRVKINDAGMINEIVEYSTAPTGSDLAALNLYLGSD